MTKKRLRRERKRGHMKHNYCTAVISIAPDTARHDGITTAFRCEKGTAWSPDAATFIP